MSDKINILYSPIHYVLDSENSGSELSWAFNIYKKIAIHKGFKSIFITGKLNKLPKDDIIEVGIIDPKKINLSTYNVIYFYLKVFIEGTKIVRSNKIDIIHHVLPFYIGRSFNLLPFFSKAKFVIGPIQSPLLVEDDDLSISDARGFKKSKNSNRISLENVTLLLLKPVLNFLSIATLKRADKIIAINKHTQELLIEKGIKKENILIIPPGINIKNFNLNRKKTVPSVNLLATGYLLKRKGFDLIIKAFAEVIKKRNNVNLNIVGDGPQMNKLKTLAKNLQLQEYIKFHGFIPQSKIIKFYQSSHIFVSMSKSEGFATVCLEAMASGLAIISTNVGGFKDAVRDGHNGYIIEHEDFIALANKIIYLIEHPKLIEQFGKRSREKAQKKYDWDNVIIPKYVKLYKNLI